MKKKQILLAVAALVVLAAAMVGVYLAFGPQAPAGEKTITLQVVPDESAEAVTIRPREEFLRGALEQEGMVEGQESATGLYVQTVNGITADESRQQWWCFTKAGETLMTGVDSTPIADGDAFEITLTTGW